MYVTTWETGNSPAENSSHSPPSMALRDEVVGKMFSIVLQNEGISSREILAEIREQPVVEVRLAMYLALRKMGFSTPQIGRRLNRDHTTVISGIRTARRRYDENPRFRFLVEKMVASA